MSNFEEKIQGKGINKFFTRNNTVLVYISLVAITLIIVIAAILIWYNSFHGKKVIINNVYIKDIDVSGLTKDEAIEKVNNALNEKLKNHIILKYSNYEFYVEPQQFDVSFDVESAVEYAFNIGKKKGFFENSKEYINVSSQGIKIEPTFSCDEDALIFYLQGIQDELPDQLEQSSYYVDDDNLIITAGKNGAVIYTDKLKDVIVKEIADLNFDNSIYEIPTYTIYPEKINVKAIHDDIYQEMQNAHFTTNPYMFYVEKKGIDFSVEDLENYINEYPNEYEYRVALTITKPEVTTDDIGIEAFPDLLATYSTKYVNNANRTTNLKIAAGKINAEVVMPDEIFSFNKVVGQRTKAEGYKDAAIFVNGSVENGLAGGICQISTTLYNAVNLANLEVTERRNHSQLATYAQPGRDATVVWGSSDLKFKNTRDYPVKIFFSVSDGYAKCSVYGLKREGEPEVSIETDVVKKTSTTLIVDAYKVYRQNGVVINKEKLHRDTYKR